MELDTKEIQIQSNQSKEIMDVRELADYLRIGKSKIYELIRTKRIPASKIGRQYRFSKEVIDKWLKERIITDKPQKQIDMFTSNKEER
jgi:excisionase family DNA binding protein